jgi:BT1 family
MQSNDVSALSDDDPAASIRYQDTARILALSWLVTNIALSVADLPLKLLLKNDLMLNAQRLAEFFAIGNMFNYIKPLAGVFTDAVPLYGTRRRNYILLGVGAGGLFWLLLGVVPRSYNVMLITYTVFYITVVLTSTSLGGKMVELGREYLAAGRLTAQRIGTFRLATIAGGVTGGWLAGHAFGLTVSIAATLHFLLFVIIWIKMPEPRSATKNSAAILEAREAFKRLFSSKVLMAAAGMTILIALSPGFATPLLYVQQDQLHFSKMFIGYLSSFGAAAGFAGAWFYYSFCKKLPVSVLLVVSIVIHALGTLLYLGYHSRETAIFISIVGGFSGTLAILPVYDLAARATPRGAEAMGYAVMMSVWNATNAVSDVSGSYLFKVWERAFDKLVWLNAGTTMVVLLVIPLLPRALMRARDGDQQGVTA